MPWAKLRCMLLPSSQKEVGEVAGQSSAIMQCLSARSGTASTSGKPFRFDRSHTCWFAADIMPVWGN